MNRPDWSFSFPNTPKPAWYDAALDELEKQMQQHMQLYPGPPTKPRFKVTLIQTHVFSNACEFRVSYIADYATPYATTAEIIDHVAYFGGKKIIRWEQYETAPLEPIEPNWMKANWEKHWVELHPPKAPPMTSMEGVF